MVGNQINTINNSAATNITNENSNIMYHTPSKFRNLIQNCGATTVPYHGAFDRNGVIDRNGVFDRNNVRNTNGDDAKGVVKGATHSNIHNPGKGNVKFS